jgi:BirA family biotin operon repressor/biotin-[acetyl-CoA-carboxylase] ligase
LAESTFDRAAFTARLATRRLGRTLVARGAAGSTNDEAWDALAAGAPDGTAIVADAQLAGRGRAGRAWHTAPGRGLALSVLMFPGCDGARLPLLPLAAGLALARALERLGAAPELKWPNDLLLNGRKVSGILAESRGLAAGGEAAVIGVGVNVSQAPEDFPDDVAPRATSLAMERCATTREAVAAEWLNALEPLWTGLQEADRDGLVRAWRARASFWGREVRVATPSGPRVGVARDLDAGGGLVIEQADGTRHTIVAGDVEHPGRRAEALP